MPPSMYSQIKIGDHNLYRIHIKMHVLSIYPQAAVVLDDDDSNLTCEGGRTLYL